MSSVPVVFSGPSVLGCWICFSLVSMNCRSDLFLKKNHAIVTHFLKIPEGILFLALGVTVKLRLHSDVETLFFKA